MIARTAQAAVWLAGWVGGNALLWGATVPFPALLPLVAGLGQWLLLRRLWPHLTLLWIPVTVIGGTLGLYIFATPLTMGWPNVGLLDPQRLAIGAAAGLAVGGGQWLLLRRRWVARWWLLGNLLGGLCLWPLYRGIYNLAVRLLDTPFQGRLVAREGYGPLTSQSIIVWVVQGLVCGTVYALVVGVVGLRNGAVRNSSENDTISHLATH